MSYSPPPIDELVAPFQGRDRDALLPVLWHVQTAWGYIGPEAVHAISHALRVPEAEIYGVIEFYTLFHAEPTGETIIRICTSVSCGLAGSDEILADLCQRLGVDEGRTTSDGKYTVERTHCLGLCEHAPAALLSQRGVGEEARGIIGDVSQLLSENGSGYQPSLSGDVQILLHDIPYDRAQTLLEYGPYDALAAALEEPPGTMVERLEESGLIGRGGAAFPTHLKWKFTRQTTADDYYLVCNADESEPGTFKDRVLMEGRPHLLLEGMALAAYTIGARRGYIFVRGEYPEATMRLQAAIDDAYAENLLGDNIMGSDFSFDLCIRRGAGAYICGEETALFEAIEGRRGFPRVKPPYPTTHGLFGKPTVVNNVETLCAIPGIVIHGPAWFREHGTDKSTGSKLVSISGHVNNPTVAEIRPGVPLREVLDRHCGGVKGNLQAVLMGGAAGTFLKPEQIDVPLTFEDLRAIGSTFGSGAIMVFNDTVDLRDVLHRLADFFMHESCGKCFPCQLGTQRQLEILERRHHWLPGDRERLLDVGVTMTDASLCGLGQTAGSAVMSAIEQWPALFDETATQGASA